MKRTLPSKPLRMMTIFLLIGSCSAPYADSDLQGKWQGASLTEDGSPLPGISPNELTFTFSETGYTYQGNLNYREAGQFHLDPPYLYTTDTINQATTEKTVEILLLTTDSLHLRMMENGKERLLKLVKTM